MAERDSRGRFVKGNTAGNGRPRRSDAFKIKAIEYADEALDVLADIMRDEAARCSDRVRACEILLERGYGRAQAADLTPDLGAQAGVIILPEVSFDE